MKGISPMIAVVLLIAFTVAVGGIISVWLTGFTRTTTGGTESRAEALSRCSAGFEIISCTKDKIYLIHYGSDLTLFPLSIVTSDKTVTILSGEDAKNFTSGTVRNISFSRGENTSVIVKAICQYKSTNVSIEASCFKGDKCWI
jgi:flagellin-like protein